MKEVDDFDDVARSVAIQTRLRRVDHLIQLSELNLQQNARRVIFTYTFSSVREI